MQTSEECVFETKLDFGIGICRFADRDGGTMCLIEMVDARGTSTQQGKAREADMNELPIELFLETGVQEVFYSFSILHV